jgi:SAM-dependent methyltransferase
MVRLPPEFFRRHDESPDPLFYSVHRPSTHLDSAARELLRDWYRELLPASGPLLDICAGESSHLPEGVGPVTGVGLDQAAMRKNPALSESWLLDLNESPELPFGAATFAGAVCSVSAQYLTQPVPLFREIARCLRPGAPFLVAFSNRMFPTKAVLAWRVSDDAAHSRLVADYFTSSGAFGPLFKRSYDGAGGVPMYLLGAHRKPQLDVREGAVDGEADLGQQRTG